MSSNPSSQQSLRRYRLILLAWLFAACFEMATWPPASSQGPYSLAQTSTATTAENLLWQDLERTASQQGLDPGAIQKMKDSIRDRPSMPSGISPAVASFVRQLDSSKATPSSSPPANFPAPVFRGTNTIYTSTSAGNFTEAQTSFSLNTLSLTTSDSAAAVSSWYKDALIKAGWQLITPDASFKQGNSKNQELASKSTGEVPARPPQAPAALLAEFGTSAVDSIVAQNGQAHCKVRISESARTHLTKVIVTVSKSSL